jgi:hypothetical protein
MIYWLSWVDDTYVKKLDLMCIQEVFGSHGLPDTIVSNEGPHFADEFWKHV